MNLTELKYRLIAFRTKKSYLAFLITQLALSVAIVAVALASPTHFRASSVLILEFVLFGMLAFDLYCFLTQIRGALDLLRKAFQ